jgi:cathepsin X
MATDKLEHRYTGGVFSEAVPADEAAINHVVEVFGWGVDSNADEYWLARNSWGSEWGEGGFFRIVTSANRGPSGTGNNMIEESCAFATPSRFAVA